MTVITKCLSKLLDLETPSAVTHIHKAQRYTSLATFTFLRESSLNNTTS